MFNNDFFCIFRTTGRKAAAGSQHWADQILIEFNQSKQNRLDHKILLLIINSSKAAFASEQEFLDSFRRIQTIKSKGGKNAE